MQKERNEKGHYNFTFYTIFYFDCVSLSLSHFQSTFVVVWHTPSCIQIHLQTIHARAPISPVRIFLIHCTGGQAPLRTQTHTSERSLMFCICLVGAQFRFHCYLRAAQNTKAYTQRMKQIIEAESQELELQWKCQERCVCV